MIPEIFIKGLSIGFLVSMTPGPIGLLCIRRTLIEGQMIGLAIGLGTAMADVPFALLAGLGLSFVSDILLQYQSLLKFFAGIFLLYLGIKSFFESPLKKERSIQKSNLLGVAMGSLLLTLTNPVTILTFATIFAGFGIICDSSNIFVVLTLALGVFVGAMIWWILLTSFLRIFHARMTQKTITFINRASGILFILFSIAAFISIFFGSECPVNV